MASSFSRTASTSNRRSANTNGTKSRVSNSRAGDYADPTQHGELPPKDYEEFVTEKGSKRLSRDLTTTERRVEKKNVVTREKIIRRSPVKESSSAGNRGEIDRQRKQLDSPTFRRKQNEAEEREQVGFSSKRNAN
jgi:gamma-tubulin complex component 2